MNFNFLLYAGAVIIDSLIGDPRVSWHPVVLIGRMISYGQSKLLRPQQSKLIKVLKGAFLVALILLITYVSIWLIIRGLTCISPLAAFIGEIILLSFTITPRSLKEAAWEIRTYLVDQDICRARKKVGWIVGRDTDQMDEAEATRATVETVAENIVDGIIAPLFFAAIGGVTLAFLYRAVNTLDSMIGYRNEVYIDFGMVAARVDDIFNLIPARITGVLIIIVSFLLKLNWQGAMRCILRDANKHPSPNSGYAEASVAGALGIRLGGLNYYFGTPSFRAYMGDENEKLNFRHIERTVEIMYGVTGLFVAIITMIVYVSN